MAAPANAEDLRIALIGCGRQGTLLAQELMACAGVRIVAVCDLLRVDRAEPTRRRMRHLGQDPRVYEDLEDLLGAAGAVDAAIIATPDRLHTEQALACMRAGWHVYLEPPMACDRTQIATLLREERRTGRVVQIGYQRRSNPRYRHAVEVLMRQQGLLGRVVQGRARWNTCDDQSDLRGLHGLERPRLQAAGYDSLEELVHWRRYRRQGGGPLLTWGTHQLDLFCWLHGSMPSAVMAAGGRDVATSGDAWDIATASYEFPCGPVRNRLHQEVMTTRMGWGVQEEFLGIDGSLVISEQQLFPDRIERWAENGASEERWMMLVKKQVILCEMGQEEASWLLERERARAGFLERLGLRRRSDNGLADHFGTLVASTDGVVRFKLPMDFDEQVHRPHLEDFLAAIRSGSAVCCPPSSAAWATIGALCANEATVLGRRLPITEAACLA